jgi:hypothetical protein
VCEPRKGKQGTTPSPYDGLAKEVVAHSSSLVKEIFGHHWWPAPPLIFVTAGVARQA